LQDKQEILNKSLLIRPHCSLSPINRLLINLWLNSLLLLLKKVVMALVNKMNSIIIILWMLLILTKKITLIKDLNQLWLILILRIIFWINRCHNKINSKQNSSLSVMQDPYRNKVMLDSRHNLKCKEKTLLTLIMVFRQTISLIVTIMVINNNNKVSYNNQWHSIIKLKIIILINNHKHC
jgi:hypothetical protein